MLLRVLAAADVARGERRSRIADDLRPAAADPAQGAGHWRAAFAAAVDRLTAAGLLATAGRGGARLLLTDGGRQRVRAVFHVPADAAPGQGKRSGGWAWWRDRYALPLALGGQSAGDAEALRAALLRRLYLPGLPPRTVPTGLAGTVDLLLARSLRVTQPGPAALRQAALQHWVKQEFPPPAEAVSPPAPAPATQHRLPDDLPVFAELTLAAARRSPTGRFGEHKVFISHVWRALLAAGEAAPEDEARFKKQLIRANTAGSLHLSRADLAGAHDTADVHASEVTYLGEQFHFVRLD